MASAWPPVFTCLYPPCIWVGICGVYSMMDLLCFVLYSFCDLFVTLYTWFLRCLCLYWDVSGDNSNISSDSSLAHCFFCLYCQFPHLGLRDTTPSKHLVSSVLVQKACRRHASNRLLRVGVESLCRGDVLCVSTQFIGHSLRFTSRTGILLFDIGKHLLAG